MLIKVNGHLCVHGYFAANDSLVVMNYNDMLEHIQVSNFDTWSFAQLYYIMKNERSAWRFILSTPRKLIGRMHYN